MTTTLNRNVTSKEVSDSGVDLDGDVSECRVEVLLRSFSQIQATLYSFV